MQHQSITEIQMPASLLSAAEHARALEREHASRAQMIVDSCLAHGLSVHEALVKARTAIAAARADRRGRLARRPRHQ
jgi:hypothetical protein